MPGGARRRWRTRSTRRPEAKLAWGDVEIFGDFDGRVPAARTASTRGMLTYVSEIPVASLLRRDALLEAGGWQLRAATRTGTCG